MTFVSIDYVQIYCNLRFEFMSLAFWYSSVFSHTIEFLLEEVEDIRVAMIVDVDNDRVVE